MVAQFCQRSNSHRRILPKSISPFKLFYTQLFRKVYLIFNSLIKSVRPRKSKKSDSNWNVTPFSQHFRQSELNFLSFTECSLPQNIRIHFVQTFTTDLDKPGLEIKSFEIFIPNDFKAFLYFFCTLRVLFIILNRIWIKIFFLAKLTLMYGI